LGEPNENVERLKSADSAQEKLWRWNWELGWLSGWVAGSWWDRSSFFQEQEFPQHKKVRVSSSPLLHPPGY